MSASREWPVIVGGCHRSGTSLVRRMLNAHSRIHCGPEVKFFRDLEADFPSDPLSALRFTQSARALVCEDDRLDILGAAFVALHERAARRAGKPRWADKNPENVLYTDHWQRLLGNRWLLVHVVRNPLDTIASIREARFANSISGELRKQIGHYRRYVQAGLDFAAANPRRCHRLLYEELVTEPEATLAGLMEWLGEGFELEQLAFNRQAQPAGLEDLKVGFTEEAHGRSLGRWRHLLEPDQVALVERKTRDLWEEVDPGGRWRAPPAPAGPRRPRLVSRRADAEGATPTGGDAVPPAPFVVGAGRSGTTLLRLMLDSHPDLVVPAETQFLPDALAAWERGPDRAGALLEAMVGHRVWGDFELEPKQLASTLRDAEPRSAGEALRAFYLLCARRAGKSRWGDKTPPHLSSMSRLAGALPEARFVHLIRDGRDVALSIRDLWWGPDSLDAAAEWWVDRLRSARRQALSLPYYLEVRYEDLVREPESQLRAVCGFVELRWDPAMLEYHRRSRERLAPQHRAVQSPRGDRLVAADERTAIHAMTALPPDSGRLERWRREMTDEENRRFVDIAGGALYDLGYDLT